LTCPDCAVATQRQHHGFTGGCRGCAERAASRSPHFARVRAQGRLDRPYQALLDTFDLTHEDVKAAAQADAIWKVPA
jgi:hypothetical protein